MSDEAIVILGLFLGWTGAPLLLLAGAWFWPERDPGMSSWHNLSPDDPCHPAYVSPERRRA